MTFVSTHLPVLRTLCAVAALGLVTQAHAVSVDVQVVKTWSGGYNADLVIHNDGAAVNGWTLSFNLGHAIKSASRASLSGSDPYTLKSLDYSANIGAGSSETVKYTGAANWNASGLKNCVFNGKACTLLVNGKPIGGGSVSSASSKPAASSSSSKPTASSSSSKSTATSSVPQPPASCSNVNQSIPNEVLIHTILNKKVSRPDFALFNKWYTEKDNVQRFQLHEGDQNKTSDILRPRVEAYVPAVKWRKSSASVWHEFSANYYLDSWDTPQLYAVFQIKTNDDSNFIVQGLIDTDGSLKFALRGKGRQKVADNVMRKPFNLRVRSNGRSLEIWVDCKRVVAADHPQPELETDDTVYGWRWGLYRQQTADDKQKGTTTLYVTGPKYN